MGFGKIAFGAIVRKCIARAFLQEPHFGWNHFVTNCNRLNAHHMGSGKICFWSDRAKKCRKSLPLRITWGPPKRAPRSKTVIFVTFRAPEWAPRCMGTLRKTWKRAPRCMGTLFAEIGPPKRVPRKRSKPFILRCFCLFLESHRSAHFVHTKKWISPSGR